MRVRLDESFDTRRNRSGDEFTASVTAPVIENGMTVIPGGARAYGRVVESQASGRFKGRAVLAFRLDTIELRGQRYPVRTNVASRATTGHKKRNWATIGGGSGFGATVGAIAGGPAGALIGAGAGAAAGTAGEALTGKKQLRLAAETPMAFRLTQPLSIQRR
ncbi:MAG TPA: hypothetical protein VHB50_01450 [Bryobacteraceae bacterium]|nr:hypothetical protein [Bryobacteraceae bacterium]